MALTDKQKRFCEEYLIDLNATQAAIRAGYSQKTAQEQSSRLLSNVIIQTEIEKLQQEISDRNKISIDELVQTLADVVRFDIAELYNEDGDLKLIHNIPKAHRVAISGVDTEERMVDEKISVALRKVRTLNKLDAIEKLMKHLGGYEKDNGQKSANVLMIGFDKDE